jgi:hypothetical protein
LAIEENRVSRGSTRIDSASGSDSNSEEFRAAPPTETPAYKRSSAAEGRTDESVDDFDLIATAAVVDGKSKAVLTTSSFDERALGVQPVPRSERGQEWRALYRGMAQRIVKWLQEQKLHR